MKSIVFGGSGMVGGSIAAHLAREGATVIGVSRFPHQSGNITWIAADLARPETINLPQADVVFSAIHASIFVKAMSAVLRSNPRRVVVISSTSVFSKVDSSDETERAEIAALINAEREIVERCTGANVEWTILRPTLIYMEGRDKNITEIAKLIRRIGFMPLYGAASGLRQPVHAEDVAIGAIAATKSPKAANVAYSTTGLETITYREMAGRVFDGLARKRRLVPFPPIVWRSAFALVRPIYPWVRPAMGERMLKDLVFDSSAAVSDFGWSARDFAPRFG
jgi:nucleoside-diphosphate-sugar epimerase